MTHKPPQGIDAGLRERCKANPTADPPQDCDFPFCGCFALATKTIETLQECGWGVLAPPDPRKDLAALEQAARKVELSVEEVRQLTLKSWPREHSNPPDVEEWRATIAALIRNNIDLKYALAEMRGAKR